MTKHIHIKVTKYPIQWYVVTVLSVYLQHVISGINTKQIIGIGNQLVLLKDQNHLVPHHAIIVNIVIIRS